MVIPDPRRRGEPTPSPASAPHRPNLLGQDPGGRKPPRRERLHRRRAGRQQRADGDTLPTGKRGAQRHGRRSTAAARPSTRCATSTPVMAVSIVPAIMAVIPPCRCGISGFLAMRGIRLASPATAPPRRLGPGTWRLNRQLDRHRADPCALSRQRAFTADLIGGVIRGEFRPVRRRCRMSAAAGCGASWSPRSRGCRRRRNWHRSPTPSRDSRR